MTPLGASLVLAGSLTALHEAAPPLLQVLGIAVAWAGALHTLRKDT